MANKKCMMPSTVQGLYNLTYLMTLWYYLLPLSKERGQEKLSVLVKVTAPVSVDEYADASRQSPRLIFLGLALNDLLFIVLTESHSDPYLREEHIASEVNVEVHSSTFSWPFHCWKVLWYLFETDANT